MFTFKSIAKHNLDYINSFVDLKVEGWKSYSKATDLYTNGFISDTLKKQTEMVEKYAKMIKDTNSKMLEVI